jgi:hypothetical protein
MRVILFVLFLLVGITAQAQGVGYMISATQMAGYSGEPMKLQKTVNVEVYLYFDEEQVIVSIDKKIEVFEVIDRHYSDDGKEIHFAVKKVNGLYTQEFRVSNENVYFANDETGQQIHFLNITGKKTKKIERQNPTYMVKPEESDDDIYYRTI